MDRWVSKTMHPISPLVCCILGVGYNKEANLIVMTIENREDIECHHCDKKGRIKHDCFKWKKKKGKGKKIEDWIEEKRDIQLTKNNTKIEEVNVTTHDSDSGNDVLFVSSCHREHALLVDTDGDMQTWILDYDASLHVTPSSWVILKLHRGSTWCCPSWGQLCMWNCKYWHYAITLLAWFCFHTLACTTCTSAQEELD